LNWIERLYAIWIYICHCFSSKEEDIETDLLWEEKQAPSQQTLEELEKQKEERMCASKRTWLTQLYLLEQEIALLETMFPEKYKEFMERIEALRKDYLSNLEDMKKPLTLAMDPECYYSKIAEVQRLEEAIHTFMEKEVQFLVLSQKLERLIGKLNMVYNVSIFHFKEEEKQKILSQVQHAVAIETKLAQECKACSYCMQDKQKKERWISLLSYADYEVFKARIRNTNQTPEELIKNLVMMVEFDEFDYNQAFQAFIRNEIVDLAKLIPLIQDATCKYSMQTQCDKLLTELAYFQKVENPMMHPDFWKQFLNFETELLAMLKMEKVEKEKIQVGLIESMHIQVEEEELLMVPKANAMLALTQLYAKTQDTKLLALLKLLKEVSNEIPYKEIYFLLLLFDCVEMVHRIPNTLLQHIEVYEKKYTYDRKTILEKKKRVENASKKEYVVGFSLQECEEEILSSLQALHMDIQVLEGKVFFNAFYFQTLQHVFQSLQTNTHNSKIQ